MKLYIIYFQQLCLSLNIKIMYSWKYILFDRGQLSLLKNCFHNYLQV